jgi:hypothetical protein
MGEMEPRAFNRFKTNFSHFGGLQITVFLFVVILTWHPWLTQVDCYWLWFPGETVLLFN